MQSWTKASGIVAAALLPVLVGCGGVATESTHEPGAAVGGSTSTSVGTGATGGSRETPLGGATVGSIEECGPTGQSLPQQDPACNASYAGRCSDVGWGLSSEGVLSRRRMPGDIAVFSAAAQSTGAPDSAPSCKLFDWWHCALGSQVETTVDSAAVPNGAGGTITPGAYRLVKMTSHDDADRDLLLGNRTSQTLYFSEKSVLFESDDSHRFSFTGSYTYALDGQSISLTPTCESQSAQYRQWPLSMTFTVTQTTVKLFSTALGYSAVYEVVGD